MSERLTTKGEHLTMKIGSSWGGEVVAGSSRRGRVNAGRPESSETSLAFLFPRLDSEDRVSTVSLDGGGSAGASALPSSSATENTPFQYNNKGLILLHSRSAVLISSVQSASPTE